MTSRRTFSRTQRPERVRAALRPARCNPLFPFVRTAFMAASCSEARPRTRAARRVWRDSAAFEAVPPLSLLKAFITPRDLVDDVVRCRARPFAKSRFA